MADAQTKSWKFNRSIGVSTCVQLGCLAALIIGSWANLQRQLDLLHRDVTMLLESQKRFEQKLERLAEKSTSFEYRTQALEDRRYSNNVKEMEG